MKLKSIELQHFRLYERLEFHCHPHLNIIIGNNAQGKTSLLESIHMLGITKSHKTLKDTEVIKTGAEFAKIQGTLVFDEKMVPMDMVVSKNGKKAKYNRIEIHKLSDYVGYLNVVMFAPEDLELIKGSPLERRRFMDLEIGKLRKPYINYLNQYRRILKERNEVLKGLQSQKKFNYTILEVITEQLIHYAEKIIHLREQFIDKLNSKVQRMYKVISDEELEVELNYEPSVKDNLKQAFVNKQRGDIQFGTTQIGPHRDDFQIVMDRVPIKTYASQGQIRSMVLAIKLAIVEMLYEEKKVYPIVLLDDVFSELDINRQLNLLKFMNPETQIFITATDLNNLPMHSIKSYQIIEVVQGEIKGVKENATKQL